MSTKIPVDREPVLATNVYVVGDNGNRYPVEADSSSADLLTPQQRGFAKVVVGLALEVVGLALMATPEPVVTKVTGGLALMGAGMFLGFRGLAQANPK